MLKKARKTGRAGEREREKKRKKSRKGRIYEIVRQEKRNESSVSHASSILLQKVCSGSGTFPERGHDHERDIPSSEKIVKYMMLYIIYIYIYTYIYKEKELRRLEALNFRSTKIQLNRNIKGQQTQGVSSQKFLQHQMKSSPNTMPIGWNTQGLLLSNSPIKLTALLS